MQIVDESISRQDLRRMAVELFGNLVKVVVDVNREVLAMDAELRSDLEALLLQNGSDQNSLWGINLYPDATGEQFIEFDSMINVRPSQNNRSRTVEDETMRKRIADIVAKRVTS
jgi:hypothetical protein